MAEKNQPDPLMDHLQTELTIRRMSEPSAQAKQSYYQLFEHVQQKSRSDIGHTIGQLLHSMVATLSWDSRQQANAPGSRGAEAASTRMQRLEYRLLYICDQAEIELMIMPDSSKCHVEGDILPLSHSEQLARAAGESTSLAPALISLHEVGTNNIYAETESDGEGRFRLEEITPGPYAMQMILRDGTMLKIDAISLT